MINLDELVLQAREQITEAPESVVFSRENLAALVPAAIARWQEKTARDKAKRQNFVVRSSPMAIADGILDLTDKLEEYGFRLEYIQDGDLELEQAGDFEIKLVSSINRLRNPGIQDKFFLLAYLTGKHIIFRNPVPPEGVDPLKSYQGMVILRSVVLPKSLAEIPSPLLPELATEVANIAKGQFYSENKGLNFYPKQ